MQAHFPRLYRQAGIAAVYFLAAQLGLSLAFRGTNISPVWPPTGIAFAAVFLFGYEVWPAIALGAFLANFISLPLFTSLGIATGNTLEAIVGVYLLRRFSVSENLLEHSRDVSLFLLLSVLTSTAISASIGTLSIAVSGLKHGASFGYLWYTWWLGDSAGNITVAPVILAWVGSKRIAWKSEKILEGLLLLVMIAFVGRAVFLSSFSFGFSLAYLTLPPILVMAFRYQQIGAATSVFLLSVIATWGTTHGYGPFQRENLNESLLFLQMFMGVIAATALLLAAVITEGTKAQEVLRDSLKEKEILLREIHHRVKNNLQVISSLLSLQSRTLNDPKSIKVFQESGSRIQAMALVHEKLYGTDNLSTIQFTEYTKALATDLFHAYGIQTENILLVVEAADVLLDINQAVPLGLIMNELISNSCKYAFPNGRKGEIIVRLQSGDPMELTISDNGIGVPGGIQLDKVETLGLRLVSILAQQLQGSISMETGPSGTTIRLKFPAR